MCCIVSLRSASFCSVFTCLDEQDLLRVHQTFQSELHHSEPCVSGIRPPSTAIAGSEEEECLLSLPDPGTERNRPTEGVGGVCGPDWAALSAAPPLLFLLKLFLLAASPPVRMSFSIVMPRCDSCSRHFAIPCSVKCILLLKKLCETCASRDAGFTQPL